MHQPNSFEKSDLNVEPIDMMNREKKDKLPAMQVDFIDTICSPVYVAFAKMSDRLNPLLDGCTQNRKRWTQLAAKGASAAWDELISDDEDPEVE